MVQILIENTNQILPIHQKNDENQNLIKKKLNQIMITKKNIYHHGKKSQDIMIVQLDQKENLVIINIDINIKMIEKIEITVESMLTNIIIIISIGIKKKRRKRSPLLAKALIVIVIIIIIPLRITSTRVKVHHQNQKRAAMCHHHKVVQCLQRYQVVLPPHNRLIIVRNRLHHHQQKNIRQKRNQLK